MQLMDPKSPLFKIVDLQTGSEVTCVLELVAGHPILQGHFPGHPVVPGACIIRAIHEAVEQATGKKLFMSEASQVKFLQPLVPHINTRTSLHLIIESLEDRSLKVSATLGREEQVFTKFRANFREA
jgi:3-hydroxyacyl-[acyl-carrier-protein] dehydratase